MKILLLSHCFFPDIGGIEVNSEIYARAFTQAGHQVRVLTWSTLTTEAYFPFEVVRNPSKKELFRQHAWADVVFENNPCLRLAWPALFFNRPSVVSLNTELDPADGATWVKQAWLKRATSVISVSEAVRRKCWPAAAVIGNPYRAREFRLIPSVVRTNNFVFLGRLVSQKGTAVAVQAFGQVLTRLRAHGGQHLPTLTIIGDGPERLSLEGLVASLNLSAHVQFTGFLEGSALARELNRYRYLLVPSLFGEAFGNVVLEGMACGCLPLVSDSDGLPDAVGKAGLIFPRGMPRPWPIPCGRFCMTQF
ncbi:glycosyltransferase family 4 protein [Hymenobacter volaticus]|uniref:Glycosyltransferase family 4 protein n=1 Tax=Hymenobacter volaticus TaxID=2932254 RepID=A0ABY4GF22_9BACT|nr:glycosyltransferase family 4 protein [Hymenobacter volaticus]UOQ69531.1 glycosyltransferase family 4 protein [Hymenobacter volaticus]